MTDPVLGSLIGIYFIITLLASFWYADVILLRIVRRYGFRQREGWRVVLLVTCACMAGLVCGLFWPLLLLKLSRGTNDRSFDRGRVPRQ